MMIDGKWRSGSRVDGRVSRAHAGRTRGRESSEWRGKGMAVGFEECLFYTLLLSDEALYIFDDSAVSTLSGSFV